MMCATCSLASWEMYPSTHLKPSRHVDSLADAQLSASIGLTLGGALMVGFSLPLILIWIRSLTLLRSFIGLPGT